MGSAAAAALVAQVAFWAVLLLGLLTRELSFRAGVLFLFVYLAFLFGAAYLPYWLPFSSCLAVLDIGLVVTVIKGDVRLP
jgi:hypothetical protein